MTSWLNAKFPNKWRPVDRYDEPLDSNEWLVAMRVGVNSEVGYDYHFWYRASDGNWYNKHGYPSVSEVVSGGVINPSVANSSDGWKLGNTYFYTSDTIYYAVKR